MMEAEPCLAARTAVGGASLADQHLLGTLAVPLAVHCTSQSVQHINANYFFVKKIRLFIIRDCIGPFNYFITR